MWLEALMTLMGSSAVGSAIGGVFAFFNRKADIEAKKLEYAHQEKKWDHDLQVKDKDLEYARLEAAGKKEVAILENDAVVEAARMGAIGAVATAETITGDDIRAAGKWGVLLVFAGVFNRLIRPVLTVVLAFAALYLNYLVIDMMTQGWDQFSTDTKFQIGMQAFAWVTAQASMAFAYWFVSRGVGK